MLLSESKGRKCCKESHTVASDWCGKVTFILFPFVVIGLLWLFAFALLSPHEIEDSRLGIKCSGTWFSLVAYHTLDWTTFLDVCCDRAQRAGWFVNNEEGSCVLVSGKARCHSRLWLIELPESGSVLFFSKSRLVEAICIVVTTILWPLNLDRLGICDWCIANGILESCTGHVVLAVDYKNCFIWGEIGDLELIDFDSGIGICVGKNGSNNRRFAVPWLRWSDIEGELEVNTGIRAASLLSPACHSWNRGDILWSTVL